MIKVVSGGQTGADPGPPRRRVDAAGLRDGGRTPPRLRPGVWRRPAGRRYRERTQANVRYSDAAAWFGDPTTPGGKATLLTCHALGRPVFLVEAGVTRPSDLTTWLIAGYFEILNVAGNREFADPGIGDRVERFLAVALGRLT